MKWVKSDEEIKLIMPVKAKSFFENIPVQIKNILAQKSITKSSKKALSEALRSTLCNNGFDVWVTYPRPGGPPLPDLDKKAKRKYEIFCGGFLYFYDVELKKYPNKISKEYPKKFNEQEFDKISIENLRKFFRKLKVGIEHKIFFEWGKGDNSIGQYGKPLDPAIEYVRIYISPPAGNPDPPRPPGPPPPESSQ